MKTNRIILFCFIITSFLTGCASSPVINTFMNPAIPTEDHSVLSVDSTVMIESIDGEWTIRSGGSGSSSFKRTPSVLLVPGKHTFQVWYEDAYANRTTSTGAYTNSIPVSAVFLKGHYYTLSPKAGGNSVSFFFTDVTDDPAAVSAIKKSIANVKAPKDASPEVLIRIAEAQDPTPFEGRWLMDKPDYTFEYHYYNQVFESVTTSKKGGFFRTRGTFEYTDNTITFYLFDMYDQQNKSWIKMPRIGKVKGASVPYELNGTRLTIQADKKTTNILFKQNE